MKGFLIFMALIVGGTVYFFTHTDDFAKQAIEALEKEELPESPEFQALMYRDPVAFAIKNKPFLEKRAELAKWIGIIGEKSMMINLAERTRTFYHDSTLSTDPAYGDLIWRATTALEDEMSIPSAQQAYDLCHLYQSLFPDGAHRDEINVIATRIQYKYNFK